MVQFQQGISRGRKAKPNPNKINRRAISVLQSREEYQPIAEALHLVDMPESVNSTLKNQLAIAKRELQEMVKQRDIALAEKMDISTSFEETVRKFGIEKEAYLIYITDLKMSIRILDLKVSHLKKSAPINGGQKECELVGE